MPSQTKPLSMLKGHRTLAEKKARQRKESELITGSALQEWPEVRADKTAHNRFLKIKSLLGAIKKDDALLESVINRYCLLLSECASFEIKREQFYESKIELQQEYRAGQCGDPKSGGMTASQYYGLLDRMQKNVVGIDAAIMAKRRMLLDIEKENAMTLLSQLRTTTQKPEKEKPDAMADLFG